MTEVEVGIGQRLEDRGPPSVAGAFAALGRLGVAFSGGVDSSVLLAAAVRVMGPDRVIAILGVSPSLAAVERPAAHEVAAFIGVPVVEVATFEGDRAEYRANGPDRCFHCKDELFSRISDEAVQAHRLDAVAYGENSDDARRPDRPGSRAARPGIRCCGHWPTPGWTRPRFAGWPAVGSYPARTSRRHRAWPPGSPTSKRSTRPSSGRSSRPNPPCEPWVSGICGCGTTVRSPGSNCPPKISSV